MLFQQFEKYETLYVHNLDERSYHHLQYQVMKWVQEILFEEVHVLVASIILGVIASQKHQHYEHQNKQMADYQHDIIEVKVPNDLYNVFFLITLLLIQYLFELRVLHHSLQYELGFIHLQSTFIQIISILIVIRQ